MFGINFSEFLLIVVVGFAVIGPKELPTVIRYIASCIREIKAFTGGVRSQLRDAAREAGLSDVLDGTSTIIDLDGKPQQAYDVRELKALASPVENADKVASAVVEKTPHE
jgi:sec-independent protein translocase protein TatB